MMTLKSIRRRISPVAFLILMLMKFQKVHLRVPTADDSKAIIDSKPDFFKSIGITDTTLLDDSLISDMASLYDTEMTPVAAIVGGILAQDILRTLSANGLPIRNWFYYNGLDGKLHYRDDSYCSLS
ncbi:hypothetical protein BDF20DRAFT_615124 [Mycotypha africana]|uniref:uncharacterized protein n=1 Tax=Mycotypha africana TaxID=64632 RepID=UPI0023012425|nr:uncharacterized protein BDF20DRAFT_615124 [Mycotypha africana]KAI8975562.1 hypothetical protein BDF20DRAFT_615124 [Mycotypha africana]